MIKQQTAGMHAYVAEKNNLDNTSSVYYEMDFVGVANNANEEQVEILIKDMPNEGDSTYKNSLYYYREAERLFLDLAKLGPYKKSVYNANYTYLISVKDPDIWFFSIYPLKNVKNIFLLQFFMRTFAAFFRGTFTLSKTQKT